MYEHLRIRVVTIKNHLKTIKVYFWRQAVGIPKKKPKTNETVKEMMGFL